MISCDSNYEEIEQDVWAWIHEFVTVSNAFYDYKFAPCPYARKAVQSKTVGVQVWRSGDIREFVKTNAVVVRESPTLTTLVMAFPPRMRFQWRINAFVEMLNAEMISDNVFLNTGVAKTTKSRYPGLSKNEPYFIVIANSLDAVMSGSETLMKTDYYKKWPADHYELVVQRRDRMAKKYRQKQ